MAISGIGGAGAITPIDFPSASATKTTGADSSSGFGDKLGGALENLQTTTNKSDDLAMQVATGDLTDIHDYMIAATQTELSTQMTVAVRNKAVDAFNQIMNMQV